MAVKKTPMTSRMGPPTRKARHVLGIAVISQTRSRSMLVQMPTADIIATHSAAIDHTIRNRLKAKLSTHAPHCLLALRIPRARATDPLLLKSASQEHLVCVGGMEAPARQLADSPLVRDWQAEAAKMMLVGQPEPAARIRGAAAVGFAFELAAIASQMREPGAATGDPEADAAEAGRLLSAVLSAHESSFAGVAPRERREARKLAERVLAGLARRPPGLDALTVAAEMFAGWRSMLRGGPSEAAAAALETIQRLSEGLARMRIAAAPAPEAPRALGVSSYVVEAAARAIVGEQATVDQRIADVLRALRTVTAAAALAWMADAKRGSGSAMARSLFRDLDKRPAVTAEFKAYGDAVNNGPAAGAGYALVLMETLTTEMEKSARERLQPALEALHGSVDATANDTRALRELMRSSLAPAAAGPNPDFDSIVQATDLPQLPAGPATELAALPAGEAFEAEGKRGSAVAALSRTWLWRAALEIQAIVKELDDQHREAKAWADGAGVPSLAIPPPPQAPAEAAPVKQRGAKARRPDGAPMEAVREYPFREGAPGRALLKLQWTLEYERKARGLVSRLRDFEKEVGPKLDEYLSKRRPRREEPEAADRDDLKERVLAVIADGELAHGQSLQAAELWIGASRAVRGDTRPAHQTELAYRVADWISRRTKHELLLNTDKIVPQPLSDFVPQAAEERQGEYERQIGRAEAWALQLRSDLASFHAHADDALTQWIKLATEYREQLQFVKSVLSDEWGMFTSYEGAGSAHLIEWIAILLKAMPAGMKAWKPVRGQDPGERVRLLKESIKASPHNPFARGIAATDVAALAVPWREMGQFTAGLASQRDLIRRLVGLVTGSDVVLAEIRQLTSEEEMTEVDPQLLEEMLAEHREARVEAEELLREAVVVRLSRAAQLPTRLREGETVEARLGELEDRVSNKLVGAEVEGWLRRIAERAQVDVGLTRSDQNLEERLHEIADLIGRRVEEGRAHSYARLETIAAATGIGRPRERETLDAYAERIGESVIEVAWASAEEAAKGCCRAAGLRESDIPKREPSVTVPNYVGRVAAAIDRRLMEAAALLAGPAQLDRRANEEIGAFWHRTAAAVKALGTEREAETARLAKERDAFKALELRAVADLDRAKAEVATLQAQAEETNAKVFALTAERDAAKTDVVALRVELEARAAEIEALRKRHLKELEALQRGGSKESKGEERSSSVLRLRPPPEAEPAAPPPPPESPRIMPPSFAAPAPPPQPGHRKRPSISEAPPAEPPPPPSSEPPRRTRLGTGVQPERDRPQVQKVETVPGVSGSKSALEAADASPDLSEYEGLL